MFMKLFSLIMAVVIGFVFIPKISLADAPFYEGKTIRIIVGMSAGGGFDTYARTIARHMNKYIPGRPTIMVENMTGAGGVVCANHLYRAANPDGLTIGTFHGSVLLVQLFGRPGYEFDAKRFEYIGVPGKEEMVVVLNKASGITSMDKWVNSKTPVKIGGYGPGSGSDNVARILKAALGLPIQLISGYKGTPEIVLAVESGELDGLIPGWDTAKAKLQSALEAGNMVVVLQAVPQSLPGLPNVPKAIDFAKSDEARQLIEVGVHAPRIIAKSYLLPPETPKERVQILRSAFQKTMQDKDFIAEIEKTRLGLSPVTGEELQNVVTGLFKVEPAMLAKLEQILFK